MNMEDINLSSKEMKMNNQLLINSSSLQAILSEEEMTTIEKMVKREE